MAELTVAELVALRDNLIRARAKGLRTVRNANGELVTYATDAEMAAAIADLEARIRRASAPRPHTIAFSASKGV